jgi:tetratricopeptide (TPR) repeat protein
MPEPRTPDRRPQEPSEPRGGSITFAASQTYVRPMQREITALINAYHQATSDMDEEAQRRLRATILERLDDFDACDGDGHAYPRWIRPVMRANALSAFGEFGEAIRLERAGAEHAEIPMHQAISANNLSDHHRKRGELDEAIEHARRAHELWPDNEGVIVNLALALFLSGRERDAGSIIRELGRLASLEDPRDILAAHLRFEDEMAEMAELPEVAELYGRIREARGALEP